LRSQSHLSRSESEGVETSVPEFFPDFRQIKTFGGALASPAPLIIRMKNGVQNGNVGYSGK